MCGGLGGSLGNVADGLLCVTMAVTGGDAEKGEDELSNMDDSEDTRNSTLVLKETLLLLDKAAVEVSSMCGGLGDITDRLLCVMAAVTGGDAKKGEDELSNADDGEDARNSVDVGP